MMWDGYRLESKENYSCEFNLCEYNDKIYIADLQIMINRKTNICLIYDTIYNDISKLFKDKNVIFHQPYDYIIYQRKML
jgi:hypothetical protein